ncbi:mitochondrial distribution/morphology family 35/apoptosis [Mycena belliarum]|uniref:Mitochondrial distribution/morphology family 35/apoptosis n=1 Tax=Mycena belliarum TaxID=1033014 RepID=A0AAD6UHS9_9AGAR|nr:mitochondrial distribution/morphology family 35/apoptosis [Mycena belliae]
MADSLSPECTPLKKTYDSCFNAWFEGYLEPVASSTTDAQRIAHYQQKAKEFEDKCGKVYAEYQSCIQSAVKQKGIEPLLQQAREEHPLLAPPPPAVHPSKD